MVSGLSSLTARGRTFLAAGVTAIVCAVILGQHSLSRVGVLLIALALIAALLVGRSRHQLTLTRTLSPQVVAAGSATKVHLALANEGRRQTGVLLLEESLPFVLGTRPRFVLNGTRSGTRRSVSYQVHSEVRGRYTIGPMTVRLRDPFGLVEVGRTFHATAPITVTPRTVPLPPVPLNGDWTGSGDNRPRAFSTGSAEDVTVREYRHGDDLRRVHWRTSARTGELMVRREEQPWQSRATVFLDNRASAHRGKGAASSLEMAVSMAASIALHLTERGFTVRLVTAEGEDRDTAWHDRSSAVNTRPLMEALAVVELTPKPDLDTSWLGDSSHTSLLVGILGALNVHDHEVLRRMRLHGSRPLAIALDVTAWTRGGVAPVTSNADRLTSLGWRAVDAHPQDRLPHLWEDLSQRSTQVMTGLRS